MPDGAFGENLTVGANGRRAGFDDLIRQRNVRGDANIPRSRAIRDPLIGNIRPRLNHNGFHVGVRIRANAAVGHDEHPQFVAVRDLLGLVFNRTSIGINVERHWQILYKTR